MTMVFSRPGDFARFLRQQIATAPRSRAAAFLEAAEVVALAARAAIGSEQDGWPALAPRTVAEKTRLGYVGVYSGTDPLLRTGDLRESIEWRADAHSGHAGSDSTIAADQEFGTNGSAHSGPIPPRPFIGPAGIHNRERIAHILAHHEMRLAAGEPIEHRSVHDVTPR